MTSLEIGKLIEKKGLEALVLTAVAVAAFSAWVFYAYAWRVVSRAASSGVETSLAEESLIKSVEADLNSRAAGLRDLQTHLPAAPDIFR